MNCYKTHCCIEGEDGCHNLVPRTSDKVPSTLRRAIGVPGDCFAAPNPECFSSSESLAAVEAYIKARQGLLFPLPAGLCFLESVSVPLVCFNFFSIS